tara:strand:+ start:5030 stop:5707 length:678 start_codon:yes stop_codon:yes gene_type:complete
MLSCFSSGYNEKFKNIINDIDLSDNQKRMMSSRFLSEVNLYDRKARIAEFFYIFFSLIITIGSVVLPALLSIQNLDFSDDEEIDSKYRERVYWITWSLSLLISISNALIQLLSLNKQYSSYITVREDMVSEGWKYLELCDDYIEGNHKENFTKFVEKIEEIKNEQTKKESSFLNHSRTPRRNNTHNRLSSHEGSHSNTNPSNTNPSNTNPSNTNPSNTNQKKAQV